MTLTTRFTVLTPQDRYLKVSTSKLEIFLVSAYHHLIAAAELALIIILATVRVPASEK